MANANTSPLDPVSEQAQAPDASPLNPAGTLYDIALDATADLEKFAQFAWNGLGYASVERQVIKIRRHAPMIPGGPPPMDDATYERRLTLLDRSEAFAAEQTGKGFPLLYDLLVVRLWSILEGLVDDIVVDMLANGAEAVQSNTVRKLTGPLIEFASATRMDRAIYLAALLTQEVKARLKPGIGRFESVLTEVGMGGGVSDRVRRALLELSEIRNVVVHRSGRADAKLLDRCPWLPTPVGERVFVSPLRFETHLAASQSYILELSGRDKVRVGGHRSSQLADALAVIDDAIAERTARLDSVVDGPP